MVRIAFLKIKFSPNFFFFFSHGGISTACVLLVITQDVTSWEWNPQAQVVSHGLLGSRLEGEPGEIPRRVGGKKVPFFPFLTELVSCKQNFPDRKRKPVSSKHKSLEERQEGSCVGV